MTGRDARFGRVVFSAFLLFLSTCNAPTPGGTGETFSVGEPPREWEAASFLRPVQQRLEEARLQAVEAVRANASAATRLAYVRASFPVATGVSAALPAQHALSARLPRSAGDVLQLDTRGHHFEVRTLGNATGVTHLDATAAHLDERHFLLPGLALDERADGDDLVTDRIGDYWVHETPSGFQSAEYEVLLPAGVESIRDAGEYLEFIDTEGVPVLRFYGMVARDAQGRTRRGTTRLAHVEPSAPAMYRAVGSIARIATEVALDGLQAPLAVDPTWTSTAVMTSMRDDHTATLLANGKVLVAGGENGTASLSSSEIFDPSTGTWTAAGSMSTDRRGAAAVLLPTGQVLVAGGYSSVTSNAVTNADLFDPATNTWSQVGSLKNARTYPSMALLQNGRVLIAGGSFGSFGSRQPINVSELFDPATKTWTPTTGAMSSVRELFAMSLLPSGKVLAAGGYTTTTASMTASSTELFDPATSTWTATGSMAKSRAMFTLTLLPTGKVLATGGVASTTGSSELYDPPSGTWAATTGAPQTSIQDQNAVLLTNGNVLTTGGLQYVSSTTSNPITLCYVYLTSSGIWQATTGLTSTRDSATTTQLPNGRVLVAGGYNSSGTTLSSTEIYDPALGIWNATGSLSTAIHYHSATLLPNGQVLLAGGSATNSGTLPGRAQTQLFNPATGVWSASAAMNAARVRHTATLLPNGQVLVAGGDDSGVSLASAELFNPSASTWTLTSNLNVARSDAAAVLLTNGKVLVIGGKDYASGSVLASAEIFDPATSQWTLTAPMQGPRDTPAAVTLMNGQVLVVGGNKSTAVPVAEVYDPATDTWNPANATTALLTQRIGVTATLLANGQVLAAGGNDSTGVRKTTALFQPTVGWTAGPAMPAARYVHAAVLLPRGKVLVAGGDPTTTTTSSSTYIYDPAMAAWTTGASMNTDRDGFSTTLLPNSGVLVAGGYSYTAGSLMKAAEIYDDTAANQAWRPTLTGPTTFSAGTSITASGSNLLGISSASGGSPLDSSTNFPLFTLLSLDNDRLYWATQSNFTSSSATVAVPNIPGGNYLFTAVTNAIPSGLLVNVAPYAPPPNAFGQSVTTPENTPVGITLSAVNGSTFTWNFITQPAHGTLSGTPPNVTYTPTANYIGADGFRYSVSNASGTSGPTPVSITVTAVNQQPTLDPISNLTIPENSPTQTVNLTGISPGPASESAQTLSLTAVSDNPGLIPNPTISAISSGSASLSFLPAANQSGSANITVTLKDNGGTANGGVDTITRSFRVTVQPVNQPPTLNAIADVVIPENAGPQSVSLSGISPGPASEASQTLTLTVASDNPGLIPTPTASAISGTTASLAFTPAPNQAGVANITVTLKDNGGTANGGIDTTVRSFKITVTAVNQQPTLNSIANVTVLENAPAQSVALTGITAGPSNEASQTLTLSAVSSNPALIPSPTFSAISGSTATLNFTPAFDQYGTALITVTLRDNGGTAFGGVDTITRTFQITVVPVNQPPTLDPIADVVLYENAGPQTIALTGISPGPDNEAYQQLVTTAESSDPSLIPTPIASDPVNGTSTLSFAPTAGAYGVATITVTVQDDGGTANGGHDTTVRTFHVTVLAVNQPPTLDPIADVSILENAPPQKLELSGISPGPASESLQHVTLQVSSSNPTLIPTPSVSAIQNGQAMLAYAPTLNMNGSAVITVTVQDDGGTANGGHDTVTRTFQITVEPVNQTPTLNPLTDLTLFENAPPQTVALSGITAGPPSESTQQVTVSAVSDNPALIQNLATTSAANGSASLTFTPAPNMQGTATIVVTVQDNGGTANGGIDAVKRSFTVTVINVNQAPTLDPVADLTLLENAGPQALTLTGISPGPANEASQQLTLTAVSDNPALIPDPTLTPISSGKAGLIFTPATNENGVATITITLKDDGGTANGGHDTVVRTMTVTVIPVNQPPNVGLFPDATVLENSGLQHVVLHGITPGPANESNQHLTVSAETSDTALLTGLEIQPVVNGDATIQFTPGTNLYGDAAITVTVQDDGGTDHGGQDTRSVIVHVSVVHVNQQPTIRPLNDLTLLENASAFTLTLGGIAAGPSNESTQRLTLSTTSDNPGVVPAPTVSAPSGGSAVLTIKPAPNAVGVANITVTVKDDGGTDNGGVDTNSVSFTVTVVPVNQPPTLDPLPNLMVPENSGAHDVALTGISAGPANESGQQVTLSVKSSNPMLIPTPTLTPVANGKATLTFTPAMSQVGVATITVTVTDDGGTTLGGVDSIERSFDVVVTAINQAPTIDVVQDLVILENAGPQQVVLTGISPGPASEAAQQVTVSAESSNPALIPTPTVTPVVNGRANLGFTPASNVYFTATITVTVKDDGGTTSGGVDTTVRQFKVIVLPVNQPPTIDPIADLTVTEDAPPQTIMLSGITPGPEIEADQRVTITATSSNPSLIPDPMVMMGDAPMLTLAPAAGSVGEATITVTVKDDGGTDNGGMDTTVRTFKVTVALVNHAPTIDHIDDITLLIDDQPHTVKLTGLSAGAANESGQKLTITATSETPGVVPSPTVKLEDDGTATLTFRTDAIGYSTITVTVQDDGGTDYGGLDTSSTAFRISVMPHRREVSGCGCQGAGQGTGWLGSVLMLGVLAGLRRKARHESRR